MLVTEFLDKNDILWEPIGLQKKIPTMIGNYKPDPNDYKLALEIIKERQQTPSEYIAIFTDKIAQYDIDIPDYKEPKLEHLPYFKSISKGLPHYFLKIKDKSLSRHNPKGGDLLTGQWSYCLRKNIVYNSENEIKEFSVSDFEERISINKFNSVIKKLKERVDEFDYDTWLRICFGIFNTATENLYKEPKNYVTKFCCDGKQYDEKAKNTIENLVYQQNGVKFGTIYDIANPETKIEKKDTAPKQRKKKVVVLKTEFPDYEEWKIEWEKHVFSVKARNTVCHDLYKDSQLIEEKYNPKTCYFIQDNNFTELAQETYFINENGDRASCCLKWNLDPNKREYFDFTFAPYPFFEKLNYSYYNTWKDYEMSNYVPKKFVNAEHCVRVYIDLKMHLSKRDLKVLDFLVQHDAHQVQFPGEKKGVGICIFGDSGTAKGTESELKKALFGTEYVLQTCDITQVTGQFTANLSRKLIVILDEAVPKNMFEKDGPLKHIMTEPTTKIERKGKDAVFENSFASLLVTTNSETPVKITNSDRRWVVLSPEIYKPPMYDEYPKNIFELIRDKDCIKCVFDYLKSIKVKYRNIQEWQINRPINEDYKELKDACAPTLVQFLIHYINNNFLDKEEFEIMQETLFIEFKEFTSENLKFETPLATFTRKISKIEGIVKTKIRAKNSTKVKYTINRELFNNYMKTKNYSILE